MAVMVQNVENVKRLWLAAIPARARAQTIEAKARPPLQGNIMGH